MSVVDILFRTLLMFAVVLLVFRVLGKRMMAELTPMDRVAAIAYGTIAGSTAISRTIPLYAGLVAVVAFAALAWFAGRLSVSSESMRAWLLGTPRRLVEKGKLDVEQLKRSGLAREDLDMRLRELKVASMADVELAQLEPDGKLGILERKSSTSSYSSSSSSQSESEKKPSSQADSESRQSKTPDAKYAKTPTGHTQTSEHGHRRGDKAQAHSNASQAKASDTNRAQHSAGQKHTAEQESKGGGNHKSD